MRLTRSSFPCAALSLGLFLGCSAATPPPEVKPVAHEPSEPAQDPRYAGLPTPKAAPAWAPPAAEKSTLENGLSVWQMGGSKAPLVSVYLMLPTGGASDPKGKEGLTLLTADMLDEGAGKLSALDLSDKLGELATDYHSEAGVDYVLLSMHALAETLPESLALLADIVQHPRLDKAEFERRKKHHLASALAANEDPQTSVAKGIHRVFFGNGYAGAPPSGTLESLERITWTDVKTHAKRMTVPEGAHLTIAGMVDPKVVQEAVKASFGKWKGKRRALDIVVEDAPKEQKAYVIDYPGASQSVLSVVTKSSSDEDANYFPEEVMNEKLGGSFTSRINMNLREDKGYTYGASSGFRRYQKAGYFRVLTNVKTEATAASVKEIFAELSAICDARPLSDKERDESVEGLLLGYPMQFDEVDSMGYRLVALPIHDRPVDFWQSWPARVKEVTTAVANDAAKPYCDTRTYSVVVAGDAAHLQAGLTEQGFEVVLLDRDGNVAPPSDDKKSK